METSLHRQLKERYAAGGLVEVRRSGFRCDAVDPNGRVVEVQSGALAPLRGKLGKLLPDGPVVVVKPVVLARRVVRKARRDGPEVSGRFSPWRGAMVDVFDDLIGLARVFPHPNLTVDVLGVEIDEVRVTRRRWPGYKVVDRVLREVLQTVRLREPADLWALVPDGERLESRFTTRELAEHLSKPAHFAQRVAYCLRHTGAAGVVGKIGNFRVYERGEGAVAVPAADEAVS
ncbi:MAG: hypothetical protein U0835_15210 [Isosphaeraceae bacterium]